MRGGDDHSDAEAVIRPLEQRVQLVELSGGLRLTALVIVDGIERDAGAADTQDHGALAALVLRRDEDTHIDGLRGVVGEAMLLNAHEHFLKRERDHHGLPRRQRVFLAEGGDPRRSVRDLVRRAVDGKGNEAAGLVAALQQERAAKLCVTVQKDRQRGGTRHAEKTAERRGEQRERERGGNDQHKAELHRLPLDLAQAAAVPLAGKDADKG